MIQLLTGHIILSTEFAGHSAAQNVVFPHPQFVYAGSEYAPVHTVPGCSLAGRVNHLPVTGGGNTTAGLAVQRWRLAPLLSEVFGLLPLEVRMCHISFSCRRGKLVVQLFIFLYPERVL